MTALAADGPVGGIGASLVISQGQPYPDVSFALPGSPAERAGIGGGARITAIDGVDLGGVALPDVIARVRGNVGTHVRLTVMHDNVTEDVDLVRADTTVASAAAAATTRDVCPAFTEILRARGDFAPIRGDALGDGWFALKPQVAGATATRLHAGLGEQVVVTWGPSPTEAAATARMDALATELRPCLPFAWYARETDDAGHPTIRFGQASRAGWFSAWGAFVLLPGNEVAWTVSREVARDRHHYFVLHDAPGPDAALRGALDRVLAALPTGFSALRGASQASGSPFASSSTAVATTSLPGATSCEVRGDGARAGFVCTYAVTGAEAVAARFDAVGDALMASLGDGWVMWADETPGYADRPVTRFAHRTSRGYERVPVVTLRTSETGVVLSVATDGVP